MQERFEGWVRVLCGGSLALAAYLAYVAGTGPGSRDAGRGVFFAALLAAAAAGFAIWPERLAFYYRRGVGAPRWSKATSVTRTEPDRPADHFATYRPSLEHLRSAFVSFVLYAALTIRLPGTRATALLLGILIGAAGILYLATRNDSPTTAG